MGMIAALNRFVSKSVDRCCPFFQLLRKWKSFYWTEECDNAFQSLKLYLANPPILPVQSLAKILYMYLAVSVHAMSVVLIRVHGGV